MTRYLRIRKEQMRVFGQTMQREFEWNTLRHLRRRFAAQTADWSDDDLLLLITHGVERAATYGVTNKTDVTHYIEFQVLYGVNFDVDLEWASKILSLPGIAGGEKMDKIDEYEQFNLNRD